MSISNDLIILVPCLDIDAVLKKLLLRHKALGIRKIRFDTKRHVLKKDSGCLLEADAMLRSLHSSYNHALVIFDHDGCGQEKKTREDLEIQVKERLAKSGWDDRAESVVIDPELEVWLWTGSPNVDKFLGWESRKPDLRSELRRMDLWPEDRLKPPDPKRAAHWAMEQTNVKPMSSFYGRIAEKASFKGCTDPSFLKLKKTLQMWFPPE